MANYTSVSREGLQKAFGLAHKLSERESVPMEQRKQFRAIATLIWEAHGEPGKPPSGSGALALIGTGTTVEALTEAPATNAPASHESR